MEDLENKEEEEFSLITIDDVDDVCASGIVRTHPTSESGKVLSMWGMHSSLYFAQMLSPRASFD